MGSASVTGPTGWSSVPGIGRFRMGMQRGSSLQVWWVFELGERTRAWVGV